MLSKLAFWKNYGEGKLADAGDAILTGMVKLDPEGTSKAEIAAEREKFEKFALEVEDYRVTYNREASEAEAARNAYNKKMDQIRALETAASADPDKSDRLTLAADKLKQEAAELLASAHTEIEEAEVAKQDLDEVEAIQEEMAETIKMLESNLKKAQAEMERAKRAENRAQKRAQHQERLAGIREGSGNVGIASKVMQEQAQKSRQAANAANRRAELLGNAEDKKDPAFEDADVAAVLASVETENAPPPPDLPDKL